jgi:hypothetical protein
MKNTAFPALRPLALALIVVAWIGCGGESAQDPQAPAQIGQMKQTSLSTGPRAKTIIDDLHMANPAMQDSWVATFGDGDRVVIYATAFETPEQAALNHRTMRTRLTMRTPRYSAAFDATVAQEPGFQFQDTASGKSIFVMQRGRWMVGVSAIAPDLEAAVSSIVWGEAK